MEPIITPVTREDLQSLCALARTIWHEHYDALIGQAQVDYMLNRFQSVPAIGEQLEKGYVYLLAKDGQGAPLGYCGYHPEETKLFLSKLYVAKEMRGKGIARMFFQKLLEAGKGLETVYLTVNKQNADSIAVYRRYGFETVEEVKTDIGNGFFMDDYIMERPL